MHRLIQWRGQASVSLTVESAYTDAGATASDSVDGDLTTKIKMDNPVNTAVIGTYTVTYTVVDNSGNAAAPVTRTVRIAARQVPAAEVAARSTLSAAARCGSRLAPGPAGTGCHR